MTNIPNYIVDFNRDVRCIGDRYPSSNVWKRTCKERVREIRVKGNNSGKIPDICVKTCLCRLLEIISAASHSPMTLTSASPNLLNVRDLFRNIYRRLFTMLIEKLL